MTAERIRIDSGCHCGNLRLAIDWPAGDTIITKRHCGCTFCRKHGGAWTSNRDASVVISITDEACISRYRFGTATADFYVCSTCGVAPVVVSEIDGNPYAVVNVNAFADTPGIEYDDMRTDFDGEETGTRLDRRKRNWIPDVTLCPTSSQPN